jgi:hypothetical protein
MAEIQRSGARYPNQGDGYPTGDRADYPSAPGGRVEYPSSRYRSYSINILNVSVPENWREISEDSSVWFAPSGAYGTSNGQAVYTHGVNFGVSQTNSRNLQQATNQFISSLQQGGNNLRARSGYQRTYVGGRNGLSITLSNTNEATGRPEIVNVITTQLRNGQLFYMITVSPDTDYNSYQSVFQNILRSLRLND